MKTGKIISLSLAIVSLCLGVWGCATVTTTTTGRDFDSSKVKQIVKGKTTADEIASMFGTPYAKHPEANHEDVWTYFYGTSTAKSSGLTPAGAIGAILIPGSAGDVFAAQNENPSSTAHNKTLVIKFDKQKVVMDFNLSSS